MNELLVFFKGGRLRATLSAQPVFSSGIASLALLQDGLCGQAESCFANYTNCPVLLAPRQLQKHDVTYRLRMGDHRILFDVEGGRIIIRRIKDRKEAYD